MARPKIRPSASFHPIRGLAEGAARVPIGRAIRRTRAFVLDAKLRPVPTAIAGELYLAGDGLADGYLRRPALTAERFVPDPFAPEAGGRLYRTGDRARRRGDGNLEFLGRLDGQIKIRGHRIELGEIEAVLTRHPEVDECVVLARSQREESQREESRREEATPGDRRLTAYVTARRRLPDFGELRAFLKERLPRYMIPVEWIPLEAIPLTPNGKADHKALRSLDRSVSSGSANFVAPHTDFERELAEIWKRVLWLEQDPGIHDDFFDLGGHSMLAAALVTEVEKAFDVELPLVAIFRLSTIAELAGHLEPTRDALTRSLAEGLVDPEHAEAARDHALEPELFRRLLAYTAGWKARRALPDGLLMGLHPGGHETPLFWCLQGFEELRNLARHLGPSRPVYGMRSGHLVMQYSPRNIRALARRYADEIVAVNPQGPYLVGGNCQGTYIAWAVAEELRRRDRAPVLLALLLLDFRQALPYPGKAALFFASESLDGEEPEWPALYPAGFTIDSISGEHHWHFVEPHVQDFADKLRRRLEEAPSKPADEVEKPPRRTIILGRPEEMHTLDDELLRDPEGAHYLHVLCSPLAAAEILREREGMSRDESLHLWAVYHLKAESATRDLQRSWQCSSQLSEELSEESAEDVFSATLTALRLRPWIAAVYRALVDLAAGRELEGRVALDLLRFAWDGDRRSRELHRILGESHRMRERNHLLWQENERIRENSTRARQDAERLHKESVELHQEIGRLHEAVDSSRKEARRAADELVEFRQRRAWKLTAPLRRLYAILRGG